MRRALFVLASAMLIVAAGSAVAGADSPSEPKTSVKHHDVTPGGEVLETGDRATPTDVASSTRVVGLQWSGDPDATFTVETRDASGSWHRAENVAKPDGGADPGSAEARHAAATLAGANVSDPVSVGNADRVRVRVESGTASDVEVVSVSSTNGGADPKRSDGGLGGSVPSALALGGVAVGAVAFPRRRGLAVMLIVIVGVSGALYAVDASHPTSAGAAGAGQPRIVTRGQWGADESARLRACPEGPDYSVPRIAVVHHSDGANGYSQADSPAIVRGLYVYSINVRGYCDLLYNFFIDRFGTIYEGRYGGITQGVVGAHATNFNTGTFGVVLMGSHTSVTPSGASIDAMVSLIAWKMSIHRMNPYQAVPRLGTYVNPIIGHRDAGAVSGDGTSCPGQAAYNLLPSIRARVNPQVDYSTPIGNVDSSTQLPGGISVKGWAIDPETSGPIQVHAYVDGNWGGAFTASVNRPDVGGIYSWLGSTHGFSFTVPVESTMRHQVCVYAINVGVFAGNPLLGCVSPVGSPIGALSAAQRVPGAVTLTGWAIDPGTADSISVHAYVDGGYAGAFVADENRHDIGLMFPGVGDLHGYSIVLPLAAGTHQLCVYGINVGAAAPNSLLGCKTVTGTPQGNFESVARRPGAARLTGWAIDQDTLGPIQVHVYVDGVFTRQYPASSNRPDVGLKYPGYGNSHGFDFSVRVGAGNHQICAYAINVGPAATNPLLGCRYVIGTPQGNIDSAVRSGSTVQLSGWALDPDTAVSIATHVYVDGRWGGAFIASASRPDIGTAYPGYGPNHGISASVVGLSPGGHQVCTYTINVGPAAPNPLLGCRNV